MPGSDTCGAGATTLSCRQFNPTACHEDPERPWWELPGPDTRRGDVEGALASYREAVRVRTAAGTMSTADGAALRTNIGLLLSQRGVSLSGNLHRPPHRSPIKAE